MTAMFPLNHDVFWGWAFRGAHTIIIWRKRMSQFYPVFPRPAEIFPSRSKQDQRKPRKTKKKSLDLLGFLRRNRDFSTGYAARREIIIGEPDGSPLASPPALRSACAIFHDSSFFAFPQLYVLWACMFFGRDALAASPSPLREIRKAFQCGSRLTVPIDTASASASGRSALEPLLPSPRGRLA
jgi:hypothetical protein